MKHQEQDLFTVSHFLILLVSLPFLSSCAPASGIQGIHLDQIKLPAGFHVHMYADNVEDARSMTLGEKGTLFVGTRKAGKVYAIVDGNLDNEADAVITLAKGLNMPNGVAFRDGSLYVAEVSRVLRFDNIEDRLNKPPKPVIVRDDFPTETHHGWKFIKFGPDGMLYIPVGAPCNVCERGDERFATRSSSRSMAPGIALFP